MMIIIKFTFTLWWHAKWRDEIRMFSFIAGCFAVCFGLSAWYACERKWWLFLVLHKNIIWLKKVTK